MEVQAKDMTWLRTDQNRRGKPELFTCRCGFCHQPVLVSTEEYTSLPRRVVELIKNPPKVEVEEKKE